MGRTAKKNIHNVINLATLSVCLLAILSITFLIHLTTTPQRNTSLESKVPENEHLIPPLWRKLGAKHPKEIPQLIRTVSRRDVFRALADEYLAPWSAAVSGGDAAPITAELLNSMEVPLRSHTVGRIRLSTVNSVLYRVIQHWDKTYRLPRFVFFLNLLTRVLKKYPALRLLPAEFYVNAADGPRVTIDSASLHFAALPIFSFRTEKSHIDIPLPDPVEHGSHVTGEGYMLTEEESENIPDWENRKETLVFRGSSSSIPEMHSENWFLNPRVRVSQISERFPSLIDAGITKWIKLVNNASAQDVLESAKLTQKNSLTLREQLDFKYVLDVDGGLGSSRKRWMLQSGSVPFFQNSGVYQWYEPLLVEWIHFVPVDKWFRDLVRHVMWAKANDMEARRITTNAREFARRFLSDEAILEYVAILLQKYSRLLRGVQRYNTLVDNACAQAADVEHGPMGCRRDWFVYEPNEMFPFWCRHKPLEHKSFVCRRRNPNTGKKEVKHGVYESYDNDYDRVWKLEREKELERVKMERRKMKETFNVTTNME